MLLKSALVAVVGVIVFLPVSISSSSGMPTAEQPAKPKPTAGASKNWVRGGSREKNQNHSNSTKHNNGKPRTTTPPTPPPCDPWKGWCPGVPQYANFPDKPDEKRRATTETRVRQVAAKLKLPNPTPRFGPDPSVNEWNMLAVGFPIWLWTDRPTRLTTTSHNDGLAFTLTATWTSTTFDMGDGHTTTCTTTTVYPPHIDKPGRPSPTCGYVYDTRSPKGHPYTVTTQTNWQIDWSSAGEQGTFNHTTTGHRTLEIGELQSLING